MNATYVFLKSLVDLPETADSQSYEQPPEEQQHLAHDAAQERERHQNRQHRQLEHKSKSFQTTAFNETNGPIVLTRSSTKISRLSDPDRLSASVDIDDLIGEYDEPSSKRGFHNSSLLSGALNQKNQRQRNPRQLQHSAAISGVLGGSKISINSRATENKGRNSITQSYYSLSQLFTSQSYRVADDETISFYSALHDGFSLDEYEWRDKFGRDFLDNYGQSRSQNGRNGDKDMMLQASEFQVFWCDLTYGIDRPVTDISTAWEDLKRSFYNSVTSSTSTLTSCFRGRKRIDNDLTEQSARECIHFEGASDEQTTLDSSSQRVTILQHLNGSFKSGQLTAVMGPSGAGKTSLLNILSRRCEDGLTGHLLVESKDANDKHKISINAIPQNDHLAEYLTVRENLMFASRLKNSRANHEKNVCRVSNLLGLDDCLDTKTGSISGGQQKRLAIAQELLSRPDILILDEPTSGLDSSTCIKTLTVLKDLVRGSAKKIIDPIAIALTIHQPQLEAFNLFDKVYVMASGGLTIYDGPPSKCADFVLKHTGISMPTPDYNPASFMIDIASGEYGQEPIEQLERQVRVEFEKARNQRLSIEKCDPELADYSSAIEVDRFAQHSSSSPRPKDGLSPNGGGQGSCKPLFIDQRLVKGSSMNSGEFFYKTRVLVERCCRLMVRDPQRSAVRVLFHLLLPLGISLMMGTEPGEVNACPRHRNEYSLLGIMKTDEYVSKEIQDEFMLSLENMGVIFITIYSCMAASAANMSIMLTLDMGSSLKEHFNGWYSMNSYLFARVLSNIPLGILLPTMTISFMYLITGQDIGHGGGVPDPYRIIITALSVVMGCFICELLGMIFGIIYMNHVTTAIFASQGALLPFVLLSGFMTRTKNMSKFVYALSTTSWFRHCMEITYIARYGWNVCGCNPDEEKFLEPRITGISDKVQRFIDYWQDSQIASEEQETNTTRKDLFKLMAKQISLYNSYGVEIKSCKQMVPYMLKDFDLVEGDLAPRFVAMIIIWLFMFVLLMLVVKYVVTHRSSL